MRTIRPWAGFNCAAMLALGMTFGSFQSQSAEITVFAAASLTDVLQDIGARFHSHTGISVAFNFGASSMLCRQIQEGAPADVFFSADSAKMDQLDKKGLIVKSTRKDRLSNSLVIVTPTNGPVRIQSPADLAKPEVKRVALADPQIVPAGIYSREFLQAQKLWPAVEPKVIPTDNVRAALAAVESGDVDAGMVFKTDAAISKKVTIAYQVPHEDTPNIRYPVAVIRESNHVEPATQFVQYLASDDATKIFEKYGFLVLH